MFAGSHLLPCIYPTLANPHTQADVIALLTHSGAHFDTFSGELSQAQIVDGTNSKHVVIMRDISAVSLLKPPDDVLEKAFDAEHETSCALENRDDSS